MMASFTSPEHGAAGNKAAESTMRILGESAGSLLAIRLSFGNHGNRERSESGAHSAGAAASLRHSRAHEGGRSVCEAARHRLAEDPLVFHRGGTRPRPGGHVAQA